MSRRRIAVCLVALVASVLVAVPSPAEAARTGELTVHFEGIFGEPLQLTPRLTLWQVLGQLRLEGIFEDLQPDGGTGGTSSFLVSADTDIITEDDKGQFASLVDLVGIPDLVLGCTFRSTDSGGPCRALGGLRGAGTLTIDVFEQRAGGRFVFHIRFPSVVCPRCPAR